MDEATLRSLLAALAATPDNTALRVAVIRALDAAGDARAAEYAEQLAPEGVPASDRAFVADVLLRTGAAAQALAFTEGREPELQLVRARALHAQGDQPGALAAYEAAVRANPTLEDRDLRALLGAQVRVHDSAGTGDGPRLRVVSNDDTDRSEIDRLLHPEQPPVAFADVGGLDDIKAQIEKRIILPFQKPTLFAKFKKKPGGGILLYGPPGCGKTLLARATAGQCNATFLNVAIEDVLDMWIGESERKLHALFEKARASTPAVMFFDELEALAGKRQYTREATSSKLVSQFLSEMDGFVKNNAGVLILAASNVPWAIDPAFRRPGRFDRVLFVPPPDRAARAAILAILLAGRPTAADIDTAALAARTSGFSGADLENLVDTAADRAIAASLDRNTEVPIDHSHLVAALAEIKPTTIEWLTTARNYARYANEGGQYDEVLEFLRRHGEVMTYQIADEPVETSLRGYAVNPNAPLLAIMLAGAWLSWPWFAFNAFALGSPTRRKELALCAVAVGGTAVLGWLVLALVDAGVITDGAPLRLAVLGIVTFKLAITYHLSMVQERTFHVYEYYGGQVLSGGRLLTLGYLVGGLVVGLSDDPLWIIIVSGGIAGGVSGAIAGGVAGGL